MDKFFTFHLPDIGEGVVEGEVIEWLKKVGDKVNQDEPVVIVMTDKATVELPATYPGIISKQFYKVGEMAIKDKPLYEISLEEGTTHVNHQKEKQPESPASSLIKKEKQLSCQKKKDTSPTRDFLAIPKVRHLAKELHVDLRSVSGSGKEGRITFEDLKHLQISSAPPIEIRRLEGDEEKPLLGIKKLMAKKMAEANTHIPQFSYFEQTDATRLVQLRKNFKDKAAKENIRLSYMPFLIRALALTIKQHPLLNTSIDMEANVVLHHSQVNIGIAVTTSLGLIVPVLKNVQEMKLEEIIRCFESIKSRALEGTLTAADMKEATITISNFGVLGEGLFATPMVSSPEVAILGIARIQKMAIVKNDAIAIQETLPLSWSFDHRVIDGELAAKISRDFAFLVRNPAHLL